MRPLGSPSQDTGERLRRLIGSKFEAMDVPSSDVSTPETTLAASPSSLTSRFRGFTTGDNRLHPVWSRLLAVFWVAMALGVTAVAISSDLIGRPLWWVDDQRWSMPVIYAFAVLFVGPAIVVAVWAAARISRVQWPSLGIAVEVALLALVDRDRSPGSAVVLGALAVAALLAAIASMGARTID